MIGGVDDDDNDDDVIDNDADHNHNDEMIIIGKLSNSHYIRRIP